MIELSIIIPVFNKYNFTNRCLSDLFNLDENTIEIIVVDNASSDETQKELSKITRKNFVYIRQTKNEMFSGGSNIGYSVSKGSHILFLNNDIKVNSNKSGWDKILLDELITRPNTLIGITGGKLDDIANFIYETRANQRDFNYISGWFLAGSKKTLDKLINKSNNELWSRDLFYFSDPDLCFRAEKLGIKLHLTEKIDIAHFGKISSGQLNISALYKDGLAKFKQKWNNKEKK